MKRELGRTGIKVYPVGLGAMPLSLEGRPEEPAALKVLNAALDAGIDFIDTANVYCPDNNDIGHNERLIAKALKQAGKGRSVTVATKDGLDRRGPQWPSNARPEFLRLSCEKSLKALGVEAIALYQLHAPDRSVPFAESVGALARLKEEGKILHVGLSNVSVGELETALRIVRVESVQNRCNPFNAEDYTDGMIRACEKHGVSYLPYSVVGGHRNHQRAAAHPSLAELGRRYKAGPYAVIIAWHLAKSPQVLPIPGASRVESAVSSAGAAKLKLAPEDLRVIDDLAC